MTNEEIQQIFFVECDESLAAAEAGLDACRNGTHDDETINAVFRAVHSVKGGAGAFGFTAMQGFTHAFETLLSDVRDGSLAISEELTNLLLRALDTLNDHVASARSGAASPDDAALVGELEAARAGAPAAPAAAAPAEAAPAPAPEPAADDDFGLDFDAMMGELDAGAAPAAPVAARWTVMVRAHSGAMGNGSEPLLMLRELANLGGECVACDTGSVPQLDQLDPTQGYFGWRYAMPAEVSEDDVREIFDFVGDDIALAFGDNPMPALRLDAPPAPKEASPSVAPAAAAAATPVEASNTPAPEAPAPVSAANQSIRIDLPKLDRLIDLVGELVIAQAMMAQRLEGLGTSASEELATLEGLTRDIQESAMAIRAQPIGSVFTRVPRILRELASSTGKHVRLVTSGEATELDKTVIERLGEPLTHLIRNAVDHGIESAADRLAAGKNAEGTLTLSAEQRSGRILIRIADDGKGIDRARVLAKAIEKGIVARDAQLSQEEIDHLIFAPGFSTAATITNVSGRGVGMDVVRQNVKELGGRISIESVEGEGTAFTLTLPLTLAISDGMIVSAGEETYVLPLAHVVESLRPQPGEIQGLGVGQQMLKVRGKFIPVIPVGDVTCAKAAQDAATQGVLIVVDTQAVGQAALLVDAIRDQRQFVIKSLDTHYRSVEGVAGATILGDGRVALILDVEGLVAKAQARHERLAA